MYRFLYSSARFFTSGYLSAAAVWVCFAWLLAGCSGAQQQDRFMTASPADRLGTEQTIELLNKAIEENPGQAEYYFQRARLNYDRGRMGQAERDLRQATRLAPSEGIFYDLLAKVHHQRGAYLSAAEALALAWKNGFFPPDHPGLAGLIWFDADSLQRAQPFLEVAVENQPTEAPLFYRLGMTYAVANDTARALPAFQKAVSLRPDYVETYLEMVALLLRTERLPDAGRWLAQALEKCPPAPSLYMQTARFLDQTRRPDSAAVWYTRTLVFCSAPGPPTEICWQASIQLSQYHIIRKNYILAEGFLKKALELKPQDGHTTFQLGYVYEYYLDRLDEAVAIYGKAMELMPEKPEVPVALERTERKIAWREYRKNNPIVAPTPQPRRDSLFQAIPIPKPTLIRENER